MKSDSAARYEEEQELCGRWGEAAQQCRLCEKVLRPARHFVSHEHRQSRRIATQRAVAVCVSHARGITFPFLSVVSPAICLQQLQFG